MDSYTALVPHIAVPVVPSDQVHPLNLGRSAAGQKCAPPRIDTTNTEANIWYDDLDSSSSSDSESDEDNEREDDVTPRPWSQQEQSRPMFLSPSHFTYPKSRKSRSSYSPLRNSFTADDEDGSPNSNPSLLGVDKKCFAGLLPASRECHENLKADMRIQITGPISSPAPCVISPPSARRAMDLRKEIALNVHAAKHGDQSPCWNTMPSMRYIPSLPRQTVLTSSRAGRSAFKRDPLGRVLPSGMKFHSLHSLIQIPFPLFPLGLDRIHSLGIVAQVFANRVE